MLRKVPILGIISIHALLAESDCGCSGRCRYWGLFLSTLSLRRATVGAPEGADIGDYFYPRSPCGERLWVLRKVPILGIISIHALLAESDELDGAPPLTYRAFLSTLSLRRATIVSGAGNNTIRISIHALLAESDRPDGERTSILYYFYPRSPCGERPYHRCENQENQYFYPRSPCGERPYIDSEACPSVFISIHALLAESDSAG